MCVASSISRRMESKVYIGNKDFLGIFGETRFKSQQGAFSRYINVMGSTIEKNSSALVSK